VDAREWLEQAAGGRPRSGGPPGPPASFECFSMSGSLDGGGGGGGGVAQPLSSGGREGGGAAWSMGACDAEICAISCAVRLLHLAFLRAFNAPGSHKWQ